MKHLVKLDQQYKCLARNETRMECRATRPTTRPNIKQFGAAQSGLAHAAGVIQDQRLKGELIALVQNMNKQVISVFQKYGMIEQ